MKKNIFKHWLILLGIIIQISFFISALWTHWYDYFFFGSSIHHCCKGLDFFQIPNGFYAFINGGDLSGKIPLGITQYSKNIFSNSNVYHPLVTIILGFPLTLFAPNVSMFSWTILKLFINLALAVYLYKTFKNNKYRDFAIFIFLTNFSQYNEIIIAQYQFLLNIFLVFFLIYLSKPHDNLKSGILFSLTLLIKPIGLLWIPALLIKKKIKIVFIGLSLFAIYTLAFQINRVGYYYTNNLVSHFLSPIKTNTIDIMSLDALLRYTFPKIDPFISQIRYALLAVIYLLATKKTVSILKIIFLLNIYFLLFYDLLYQYHFSILGPLLCVCLLKLPEFQTKIARVLILIINLPSVFFIIRMLNIGVYYNNFLGNDPTFFGWQIVSFFQIIPIFCLALTVFTPEIKELLGIKKHIAK